MTKLPTNFCALHNRTFNAPIGVCSMCTQGPETPVALPDGRPPAPHHYTIVYGEHFTSESVQKRKQDAAEFVKKAIGAGTVRSDEEHQADFEGEEPTDARERINREQEANPQEGQGRQEDVKGFGSWTAAYPCSETSGNLADAFSGGDVFDVAPDDMVIAYVGHVKQGDQPQQQACDHAPERAHIKLLEQHVASLRMEVLRLNSKLEASKQREAAAATVIHELRTQVERVANEKQPELRSRRTVLVDIDE